MPRKQKDQLKVEKRHPKKFLSTLEKSRKIVSEKPSLRERRNMRKNWLEC